jgi:hypothetical protein
MEATQQVRFLLLLLAPFFFFSYLGVNYWKGYQGGTRAELVIRGHFDSHTERRVREYILTNLVEGDDEARRAASQVWRDEFLVIQTHTPILAWLWGVVTRSIGALLPALLVIRLMQGPGTPMLMNVLLLGLLIGLSLRVGSTAQAMAYEKEYNRRALSAPIPREEMIRICRWHRTSWDIIQHQVAVSHRQTIGSGTKWQAAYRAARREGPLDPDRALFALLTLLSTVILLIWLRRKWLERKSAAQS